VYHIPLHLKQDVAYITNLKSSVPLTKKHLYT
jgi:hypothetical protein